MFDMKRKIYSKVAVVFIALIAFTSCRDMLETADTKVNPNAPADAPIDVLVSGTLVGLAAVHEDTDTRISYMWAGQLAGLSRQHAGFEKYIVAASTFDNSWAILYNTAANARLIQTKAAAINNKTALGVGQVMEALLIAKAAVLYGDIPYSQAFNITEFPTPVFDKQLDVYASLISVLENAHTNLKNPVGEVGGDFIYGGDPALWAGAAKTLQARLYLQLAKYPEAIAAANLGIASEDDDALVPHGESQQVDMNLNFDFFENSRPGDTGFDDPAFMPTFMKTRLDGATQPLVPIIKNTKGDTLLSSTGDFKATRNSKTDETALYNHFIQIGIYSGAGIDPNTIDGMFTSDAPHPILTFYENQLILAEAYARLGTAAGIISAVDALNSVRQVLATGYINGKTIGSTYKKFGIQYDDYLPTDFNPGGLANPASTGRDQQTGLLYEIETQKYFVSLAQYNVFSDVRRWAKATPVVTLPIPIVNGSVYPARFIYPQGDINTNPNVPKPLPDQFVKLPIFQ